MLCEEGLLSLIEEIYDAALEESRWQHVMERVLEATGSQAASFCVLDSAGEPTFTTFATVNFDPVMIDEYLAGMALNDPTVQAIAAHPERKLYHDSALISESEKDRHIYYNWHGRLSDTRHRLAGMASPDPSIQAGITVHRTAAAGDYDADTKARFAMLFRHLERALEVSFRLGTLGALKQMSDSLLDRNPLAIILFDDKGRVIQANRAAADLTEERDGVILSGEEIRLARASDDRALQKLIAAVLAGSDDSAMPPGGIFSAIRPSGRQPLAITVSPVSPRRFRLTAYRPAGCVLIVDPEKARRPSIHGLQELYDLTRAEARLACEIANGVALRAAAASLGIAYSTARAQLSAIFRKTSTQRQGELVKLLLASVPTLTV